MLSHVMIKTEIGAISIFSKLTYRFPRRGFALSLRISGSTSTLRPRATKISSPSKRRSRFPRPGQSELFINNPYIRNLIQEVLFIPRLMLRLPPILAGVKITSTVLGARLSHWKWRLTKQHPSRTRSGHQVSCCLSSSISCTTSWRRSR